MTERPIPKRRASRPSDDRRAVLPVSSRTNWLLIGQREVRPQQSAFGRCLPGVIANRKGRRARSRREGNPSWPRSQLRAADPSYVEAPPRRRTSRSWWRRGREHDRRRRGSGRAVVRPRTEIRASNSLLSNGFSTVGDVVALTAIGLETAGVGPGTLVEIKAKLSARDLTLRPDGLPRPKKK